MVGSSQEVVGRVCHEHVLEFRQCVCDCIHGLHCWCVMFLGVECNGVGDSDAISGGHMTCEVTTVVRCL